MAAVDIAMDGMDDLGPVRKKPKVSELPLSSAKRASIDGLLHTFKKKGEFDALRKKTYAQFEQGHGKTALIDSLRTFTDAEIDRDPTKYLAKDRRLAAPLLEGAAARADIYPATEADIGRFITGYLEQAEIALRAIRRKEIGEDAARDEAARGAKTDDAYAADAEARRQVRAKKYAEQLKLKKKKEREERRKKELEELKKRALELTREKEKLELDQKRRAEREAIRAREKEKERERLKKFEEEREKKRKEREQKQKDDEEAQARRKKEHEAEEAKRLEEQAMRMLLREGERLAEKTNRRPELERSESMEPPSRRTSKITGSSRISHLAAKETSSKSGDTPAKESRIHSPGRGESRFSNRRDDRGSYLDEDRSSRRDTSRREAVIRDISAEREAWKAKLRREKETDADKAKPRDSASVRARSKSAESRSKRNDKGSHSPPRHRDRAKSRSRTPPRRGYREREHSPPRRRRSRSRSPPDIDRYVPGGSSRRRDDRDRDRDRERDRDRDRDDRDRRRTRDYDDRPKPVEIDRYVPGGSSRDTDRRSRRESSRSRSRDRRRRD